MAITTTERPRPTELDENAFLRLCGLRLEEEAASNAFRAMKRHVADGAQRLRLAGRRPDSAHSGAAGARVAGDEVTFADISERAMRDEIGNIYQRASAEARSVFDRGAAGDGENWIIRWMLWRELRE